MKWISVKDELPPDYELVMICAKDKQGKKQFFMGRYDATEQKWCDDTWDYHPWTVENALAHEGFNVIAWMKFPELPQER